jgi:hypothetical protein
MRKEVFLLASLSLILSCSNSSSGDSKNTGGTTSSGGTTASGGIVGTGGTSEVKGTGGVVGTGGKPGTGGATDTGAGGKIIGTGGKTSPGGTTGTAGKTGTAGSTGTAGKPGTDGGTGVGGKTGAGGSGIDGGSGQVGCDRAGLQAAVDTYIAAVEAKDTTKMPLASSVKYTEVIKMKDASKTIALSDSVLFKTAMPVKYDFSLLDTTGCETFTEVFITEGSHPYVLGTRLTIKDGKITEIYTLATDTGDWNFDATAYDKCAESEDWSIVPAAKQSSRDELIAAGQAYFDIFSKKDTVVPWGNPCYRLEGGKGCTPDMDKKSTSCNVGIPDGITFTKTHWVVDVDLNACVGITMFGSANPDSHMFRLVDGKIRYVHTLTVME